MAKCIMQYFDVFIRIHFYNIEKFRAVSLGRIQIDENPWACLDKYAMYGTERSQSWSGMLDFVEDFEKRCCLALSYFYVLKRFPIDKNVPLATRSRRWKAILE